MLLLYLSIWASLCYKTEIGRESTSIGSTSSLIIRIRIRKFVGKLIKIKAVRKNSKNLLVQLS